MTRPPDPAAAAGVLPSSSGRPRPSDTGARRRRASRTPDRDDDGALST